VARIYRDWKPIFAIDFASNDDPSWTPSRIDYSNVRGKEIIQNGHLAIQATATQEAFWDQAANTGYVTDFFATLEVEQTAGERAEYGMEFRRNDATGFYWLAINGDGEYAVYMFNDAWSTLIGWTRHPAILSGTKNRLAIIGIGSDFTIIINDQYVTEFKSDVLPGGRLGIALQLSPSSKQATIQFDNIELRAP
jgi:hypothetical protein